MANVTASVGLVLDNELKSVIDLKYSSFFLIEGRAGINCVDCGERVDFVAPLGSLFDKGL